MPTIAFLIHLCRRLNLNNLLLCGLLLLTNASQAIAALGQAPSLSVTQNLSPPQTPSSKRMAFAPVVATGLYTLHETQLENGTSVREFDTPGGVVFAVAWRGPVLPDLSDLLGNYFDVFKREVDQARAAGRRGAPVHIRRDDLVVKSNGRMRHFFGHAYAPALVPAGVNINDLLQ
jgi:hypothetical protein